MGQTLGEIPEAPALGGGDEPGSIGSYLGRQRRLRGISLDELAALTRLPRRSLERLEAGAYDRDPDGFVRGFVRTVGCALGLDPDDAVARMLPEVRLGDEAGSPWLRRLGMVAVGVLLLSVLVGGLSWVIDPAPPSPLPQVSESRGIVYRRDAVRALAERVGVVESSSLVGRGEAAGSPAASVPGPQ